MQNTLLTNAETDARRNADAEFERRAYAAQLKDCTRQLRTVKSASSGVATVASMFEDTPTPSKNGQVSLF